MKRVIYFASVVTFLLLQYSCNNTRNDPQQKQPGSHALHLLDSIKKFDSLAYLYRISKNGLSVINAKKAMNFAGILKSDEGFILAYIAKCYSFLPDKQDSVFYFLAKALKIAEDTVFQKYKPDLLYTLACLNVASENNKTAILLLDSCINMKVKTKNFGVISLAYNVLGNIHFNIPDPEKAKTFYDSAYNIALRHNLYPELAVALGNLVNLESDTAKRIVISQNAISLLKKANAGDDAIVDLLINIGYAFSTSDSALFYFNEALKIAKKANLPIQQMGAYNNLAYFYLGRGMNKQAESCLRDHAIPIAVAIKSPDWLSTLYDSYSDVLVAKSDYIQALFFEKKSIEARLEADKNKSAGQVRLLDAMLDLKNKQIIIKDKDQEIQIRRFHEQQLISWLTGAVLVILAILLLFTLIQFRSRLKLQNEKIRSARLILSIEETEKKKIAMELHDVAGQYIMDILGEVENAEIPDSKVKTKMFDKVRDLSQSIRSISHRLSSTLIEQLSVRQLIVKLCDDLKRFSGLNVQLTVPEDLPEPDDEIKIHTFRIIQEMMNNAVKYASGARISLTLFYEGKNLQIIYSDDGPGFDHLKTRGKGMGLSNITERAKLMGGNAVLDSAPGFGVHWEIMVPGIKNGAKKNEIK